MTYVLAVLKALAAIPAMKEAFDQFVSWYVRQKIEAMRKEDREAIKEAVLEHDQRRLEHAIGNPNAGEPSGIPGTIIVDDLPGVRKSKWDKGVTLAQ
jgi:hypothetical protein